MSLLSFRSGFVFDSLLATDLKTKKSGLNDIRVMNKIKISIVNVRYVQYH